MKQTPREIKRWSPEELALMRSLVASGEKPATIKLRFPDRSDTSVKSMYHVMKTGRVSRAGSHRRPGTRDFSISIQYDLYDRVQAEANRQGMTKSAITRIALRQYLQRIEKEQLK